MDDNLGCRFFRCGRVLLLRHNFCFSAIIRHNSIADHIINLRVLRRRL